MHKMDSVDCEDKKNLPAQGVESGSVYAEGTITNWMKAVIHSQFLGLVRAGARIKIGTRTDLRIRWTTSEERSFVVGQPVVATIPADAVRLESGMFRRSKQRWNRWMGRIVLIEEMEVGIVYTVKVHREEWTLKSLGPVLGAKQPMRPWDVVNVVVDPQAVDLAIAAPSLIVGRT